MPNSILIVDDDPEIISMVGSYLQELGFLVDSAADGDEGLSKATKGAYSLVVVDVAMPKLSGFEFCRRLRTTHEHLPILMLTAKTDEIDKVLGLELGADDYLTKPFGIRELTARINGLIRCAERSNHKEGEVEKNLEKMLVFGDLRIDTQSREVFVKGEPVHIPRMEYNLLEFLARHPGMLFEKEELTTKVWGASSSVFDQVVSTAISRLRTRIEADPNEPIYIKTVRGFGYKFAKPEDCK